MVVLVRRVLSACVEVDGLEVSAIGGGLLLYVGLAAGDTKADCDYFAEKISKLRIFDSSEREISVKEAGGGILSVSQFTLSADTKKGCRPSYMRAMPSKDAEPLFDYFNEKLQEESCIQVQKGVFGADMKIHAVDDGPFTIILTKT